MYQLLIKISCINVLTSSNPYSYGRRVYLLVDSRHGMKTSDIEMMKLLDECGLPYQARTVLHIAYCTDCIAPYAVLYTVLYTVRYTALYTALYTIHCIVLYCTALHNNAIWCAMGVVYTAQFSIVVYCSALYRTVPLNSPLFPLHRQFTPLTPLSSPFFLLSSSRSS